MTSSGRLADQANALRSMILADNPNSPMANPRWKLWATVYSAFITTAGGWQIGDARDIDASDLWHPADPLDPPRHPAEF